MLRRLLAAALVAGAATGALLGLTPAQAGHERLEWRGARTLQADALSIRVPSGWHVYRHGSDGELVFVSSFRITRRWVEGGRRKVPRDEAVLLVFTYGRGLAAPFPRRPAPFRLSEAEHGFYECALGLEGYLFRFDEDGLAVQAELAFGEGTDPSGALAVLATLRGRDDA